MRQVSCPGNVVASRLPVPPDSTSCAVPCQKLPRGDASTTWLSLACQTSAASHRAGANTTSASARPARIPAIAQRQGAAATAPAARESGYFMNRLTGWQAHHQHTIPDRAGG